MNSGQTTPNRRKSNNQIKIILERSQKTKPTKYFGILEADTIKQVEIKKQDSKRISQENYKTTRDKTLLPKSYQRNTFLGGTLR